MEELTSPTSKVGDSPSSPAMDAATSPTPSPMEPFVPPATATNGIEVDTPSSTLAEAATPAMEDAGTPPTEASSPDEEDTPLCNGQTAVAMAEDNAEDQGPLGLLVHIDMKGGPPRPQYLLQLLPLLKQWGATGLLIEWEDMFPWEVHLPPILDLKSFDFSDAGRAFYSCEERPLDSNGGGAAAIHCC